MKKFFAQLRPMERRLAVGVLVVLIIVLNWIFIWPHFSDFGDYHRRKGDAEQKLVSYQTAIKELPKYQDLVHSYEKQGESVAPDDQALNFLHTVQMQAASSQLVVQFGGRNTRTNQFFAELSQGITALATDSQLIDFLYKLGSGASMMRVRDLDLQPDAAHQHLNANITLVASYQKKPSAPAPATPAAPAPAAPAPSAPATPKPAPAVPAHPPTAGAKPVPPPPGGNTNFPVRTVPTKLKTK